MTESAPSVRQLISQRALALGHRFLPTLRPLFVEQRGAPVLVASGVLLRIDAALFLLTAAHALDLRDRGLHVAGTNGPVPLAGEFIASVPPEVGGREADRADVGIVRLSSLTSQSLSDLAVLGPSDIDIEDRALGDDVGRPDYVLLGFPASRAKVRRPKKHVTCNGFILTALPGPVKSYKRLGVRDETHIILAFDPGDVTDADGRAHPPGLKGVSGGGIWRAGRPFDVEGRGAKLVAIMIEWHQRAAKAILGVRLALFLEVLRQHYPELSEHIPQSSRVRIRPRVDPA